MDCLFADVSEFQVPVNDSYPHKFISIRSNDGTYRDKHFAQNLAWSKSAVQRGKITGFIVYFVYEPNWQQTVATLQQMVGSPDPHMAVMIDCESWGRIFGNNSAALNATREAVIHWLGGNRKRVIGYGNAGDLQNLWPQRGDIPIILANYGGNPRFPNEIAHQFADNYNTPPFGPCDINSADGRTPQAFAAQLGLGSGVVHPVPAPVAAKPRPVPARGRTYTVVSGDTLSGIASKYGTNWQHLAQINGLTNADLVFPGQVLKIDAVAPTPVKTSVYTVKQGDNLRGIAARYPSPSITADSIARLNRLANPDLIFPGQVLRIG